MEGIMSGPAEPFPVMPMVSIIFSAGQPLKACCGDLREHLGIPELRSGPYPFDLSDYYRGEMGGGLSRIWLAFGRLADPSSLIDLKHFCRSVEEAGSSAGGKRKVNIDPGYLDYGKLVLASFKEAPDKIYMGRGVWAHACLRYGHGRFTAPDHSFPDFRDGRFDEFMLEARRRYRRLLRSAGK